MTKAGLIEERNRRGDEYAAMLAAFKNAYIRLAGIDMALRNSHVGHGDVVRGFAALPDTITLQHPIFAPTVKADWAGEIKAEHAVLLDQFVEESV